MKYTGAITILDDKGNSIFERELSPDEIIDVVLAKPAPSPAVEEPERAKKVKKGKPSARVPKDSSKKWARSNTGPKKTSGKLDHVRDMVAAGKTPVEIGQELGISPQGAHYYIKQLSKAPKPKAGIEHPRRRMVSERHLFSEGTYSSVKNSLEDGELITDIVRAKGLDEDEVRRVNLSDSYEDYTAIG